MEAAPSIMSIEERRKQCVLGQLPADFLRLEEPAMIAGTQNDQLMAQNWAAMQQTPQFQMVPQLDITIAQAKLAKNYGIQRMDPYCRLRIGNQILETTTCVGGSKNPKWNKRFTCKLPHGVDSLFLEIFDDMTFTSDDKIAWAYITLPPAIFNGDTIDDWYFLSGQQGEEKEGRINIIISYREVQAAIRYGAGGFPGFNVHPYNPGQMQPHAGGQMAFLPAGVYPQGMQGGGQPLQQQPLEISEEDVKAVAEMFPTVEEIVVKSVLEEKAGDKEAAINALLQMTQE